MEKTIMFADDTDRLLNIAEVAARLKSSPTVVSRLVKSGMLRACYFGKCTRVRKVTLNDFLRTYDGQNIMTALEAREAKVKDG